MITISGSGAGLAVYGLSAEELVILPKHAILLWLAGVDFAGQNIYIQPDPESESVNVYDLYDNVKTITTSGSVGLTTISGENVTFSGFGGVTVLGNAETNEVTISGGADFGIVRDEVGNLYAPDPTRSGIVLSIYRDTWTYGRSGNQKLSYLGVHGVNNANAGYVTHRDGMITSITSHHDVGTMDLHVTESGVVTQTIAEFNGLASGDNILEPLSIEVPGNELLQLYLANTGNVKDAVVAVEIAWRL
jgi:hypothetical protein